MEKVVRRYGVDIDLSQERKTACPRCQRQGRDNNQDNLHIYGLDSEGRHKGAFCWACEYAILSEEMLEQLDEGQEEEIDIMGKPFTKEVKDQIKEQTGYDPRGYRGISKEVSQKYRVRYQYSEETGEVDSTLYPCTQDYQLTGYKVRKHPKDFKSPGPIGETGKDCDLFGQHAFKESRGKYVLITSGEHDALAAFEMLYGYQKSRGNGDYEPIPVVSGTVGEAGTWKQLQKQYEWLNRFDRIVYCADPDEAGKRAVEKIAKVVPKKKLFVMTLATVKDPNDALVRKKQKEFISKFFSAPAYVPSGIVGSDQLIEKIKEAARVPKIPLPPFMHRVQSLMAGGIPLQTITCLGSASGSGKSTYVDELVYYWAFHSPHRVGVISLESDCAQYGTKILSRHIGKKIDLIESDEEKLEFLDSEEISQASDELFKNPDGSPRFHLIEERDGSIQDLKELIMQLIIECEVKVCIIDPLQDILDGLSNDEQASFMRWLKGMLKSHNVSFILVNHLRKSQGGAKANSTGADIHEEDFQGSSAIFKSSACNLLFNRNKEHEDEIKRNVTVMKMTKCRWSGRSNPVAGKFFYDNDTHTLHDLHEYLEANPQIEYHEDDGDKVDAVMIDNPFPEAEEF